MTDSLRDRIANVLQSADRRLASVDENADCAGTRWHGYVTWRGKLADDDRA